MKLSVVVVSFNQCKLLCRTLKALTDAAKNLDAEIILIDNGSEDKTLQTVMKEFPLVRTTHINNQGYARAANHGIGMAKGEYILLLSPDILTKKVTLSKAVEFMERENTAGGISVRMLDEQGNYLAESKKVLPNTWLVFLKMTGLLKDFSKSRLTEYYKGNKTDEFETTETDVLNNAFMLIRRSVLPVTGLLDERFGNYGAHIDLSHRMRLAGFKNFYFPKTYVINLQNNKLPRFSWDHLKSFYGALIIFALKYLFRLPALYVKPVQELYPAYEFKG